MRESPITGPKPYPELYKSGEKESPENTTEAGFAKIVNSTHCPFAFKSNLEYAEKWEDGIDFEKNLISLSNRLISFTDVCDIIKLDGIVVEVKGLELIGDLKLLALNLKKILLGLNTLDPKSSNCMTRDISANSWQFEFNGKRIFMILFAPFYSETSPRNSLSDDSAFIFMQPESSFHTHIINPANSPQTIKLKDNIRESFAKSGKPYDLSIVTRESDAIKYIKPLNIGDPIVEWWK